MFGGIREGRGYAIAFGAVSLIIGAIMAFEPMTGALSLTLLVVFWLGLRGLLELAWAIRSPAHRGWMIALGILNLLLALLVLATISWSSMTRSEEHTSELQSLMRISYAVFCLKKHKNNK